MAAFQGSQVKPVPAEYQATAQVMIILAWVVAATAGAPTSYLLLLFAAWLVLRVGVHCAFKQRGRQLKWIPGLGSAIAPGFAWITVALLLTTVLSSLVTGSTSFWSSSWEQLILPMALLAAGLALTQGLQAKSDDIYIDRRNHH
jgi:hypothetical protein